MRRRSIFFTILFIMILSTACQPASTATPVLPSATLVPPTATLVPPTATPSAPVLDIVAPDGSEKKLSMEEVKALPTVEGQAGIKSSTGKITPPALFKGVSLKDLAALAGTFDETMGINMVAEDGYAITFSFDQATNGTFISYDPSTGEELKSPDPLTAILAYEMDGKSLDPKEDGLFRVVIISEKNNQVTDGHWSVKWVNKVEVKPLGKEWSLHLEGTINELMDRATFESGAAPNCHGVTWKDEKAQEWVGIPLWLLVGRVDDSIKHEGPAFNDALAEKGYSVDVVASDGYTVSFDIARLKRNNNIIVAHLVNANPLPDKYFPLRLVGSDLQKNEMVGMIEKIILNLEGIEIPVMTSAPVETQAVVPSAGELWITGLVEDELKLKESDLRLMEVVKISAEHPKKGMQEYEGIRLNALLEKAKVKPEAKKLVITASDGFVSEVFLTEMKDCADCLVAFTESAGLFNLVMPGLPSSAWVKEVVSIEVK